MSCTVASFVLFVGKKAGFLRVSSFSFPDAVNGGVAFVGFQGRLLRFLSTKTTRHEVVYARSLWSLVEWNANAWKKQRALPGLEMFSSNVAVAKVFEGCHGDSRQELGWVGSGEKCDLRCSRIL